MKFSEIPPAEHCGFTGWLLAIMCAIPLGLLSIPLKFLGEQIGNELAFVIKPILFIPTIVRFVIIFIFADYMLTQSVNAWFVSWTVILGSVGLIIAFFISPRLSQVESSLMSIPVHLWLFVNCYSISAFFFDSFPMRLVATGIISALPTYFVRSFSRAYISQAYTLSQKIKNERAVKINKRIQAGLKSKSFCLYLRGFEDGHLEHNMVQDFEGYILQGGRFTGRGFSSNDSGIENYISSFKDRQESILEQSCSGFGYLIGAGDPNGEAGAGRFQIEDGSWEKSIAGLIKKAKVIFVVPNYRKGTIWEIKHIIDHGFLNKTIFLDQCHANGLLLLARSAPVPVRELLQGILSLPKEDLSGKMFIQDSKGATFSEEVVWTSDLINVIRIRFKIKKLLNLCRN